MELPTFENYMDTTSANYGLNSLRFFDTDGNVFWYSYKTLVAFKTIGGERVVRKNIWGPTTGKHLNAIDGGDKATRIDVEPFQRLYQETFARESCPHCGADSVDATGENAHYRDCQEA